MNFIGLIAVAIGSYTLTVATPDQAPEIADLVNAGYQREVTRKEGTLRYPDPSEVRDEIENTQQVSWFILQDPMHGDKIIGSLETVQEAEGKSKINAFAIDKDYSGQKLGVRMLEATEEILKEKGVEKLYLKVISVSKESMLKKEGDWIVIEAEPDSLAGFYQKNGFHFTGNSTLTPLSWQKECRKTEYVGRIFLREMYKQL